MTDRSAAAIKAHETRRAIKKARRTGDYSQDPRVHAIRTDPKINDPNGSWVVSDGVVAKRKDEVVGRCTHGVVGHGRAGKADF